MDSLRDLPAFESILIQADKNANPCKYDEQYGQLDFWVGSWDVYNLEGQKVGTNTIEKLLHDCLILENWHSQYGNPGKSMNYFDPSLDKWRQQWVSASGYVINYTGEFEDGTMRFQGENITQKGETIISRMSLEPLKNGNVRQIIQRSENGDQWTTWFEGLYVPQGSPAPGE